MNLQGLRAQEPNLKLTSPWAQTVGRAFPDLGPASWHTKEWCHAPDTVSCLEHVVNIPGNAFSW